MEHDLTGKRFGYICDGGNNGYIGWLLQYEKLNREQTWSWLTTKANTRNARIFRFLSQSAYVRRIMITYLDRYFYKQFAWTLDTHGRTCRNNLGDDENQLIICLEISASAQSSSTEKLECITKTHPFPGFVLLYLWSCIIMFYVLCDPHQRNGPELGQVRVREV